MPLFAAAVPLLGKAAVAKGASAGLLGAGKAAAAKGAAAKGAGGLLSGKKWAGKLGKQLLQQNQRMPLSQRKAMQAQGSPQMNLAQAFSQMSDMEKMQIREMLERLGLERAQVEGAGRPLPGLGGGEMATMQQDVLNSLFAPEEEQEPQDSLSMLLSDIGSKYGY